MFFFFFFFFFGGFFFLGERTSFFLSLFLSLHLSPPPPSLSLSLFFFPFSTHVVIQRRVPRDLAAQQLRAQAQLRREARRQRDALADAEVVGALAREADDAAEEAPLPAAVEEAGGHLRRAVAVVRSRCDRRARGAAKDGLLR